MADVLMTSKKEFTKLLKGPISQLDLEATDNARLFKSLDDLKLDIWTLAKVNDKPMFFRFYHKFAGDVYGISIKIGDDCNKTVTENCITFTNITQRKIITSIPEEVSDAGLLSVKYKQGKLKISSSPLNSKLLIDDEDTQKLTPQTVDLVVGEHKVTLAHEDFEDVTEMVSIEEGRVKEVFLRLPFGA